MRHKWIRSILIFLLVLLFLTFTEDAVFAVEIDDVIDTSQYDYSQIQEVIDEVTDANEGFHFSEFVDDLISGQTSFSIGSVLNELKDGLLGEIKGNFKTLSRLLTIAIIAAVFTNFASVFLDNQVAETGFYITYILMFCMIVASFSTASKLAVSTANNVVDFMKVLMPSYFMAVTMVSGVNTSLVFYEFTLIIISLINLLIIKILIPAINIYLIVILTDNLSKDEKLSKFAETIATGVKWALRSLIVLVFGFNAIQALITPVAGNFKRSLLTKAQGAIPGVGDLLSGVTETVLGAGVLLKNSIGVAGLVVLITICAVPILKLIIYYFIYRIGEATLQPISDKRLLKCIGACSEAVNLLLQIVIVVAILFIITITIVTASTTSIR